MQKLNTHISKNTFSILNVTKIYNEKFLFNRAKNHECIKKFIYICCFIVFTRHPTSFFVSRIYKISHGRKKICKISFK